MQKRYENLGNATVMPEHVMPEQFYATTPPSRSTGARRLLQAVFTEALTCLNAYHASDSARERRLFNEAYDWFMSTEDNGLYSFESIVLYLDLNADRIRREIKERYGKSYTGGLKPPTKAHPMIQRDYAITGITVLREIEHDPSRGKGNHAGMIVRLPEGKVVKIPFSTIRGDDNWPRVGETGDLTISLHFACRMGLVPGAPKYRQMRRFGGEQRAPGAIHEPKQKSAT